MNPPHPDSPVRADQAIGAAPTSACLSRRDLLRLAATGLLLPATAALAQNTEGKRYALVVGISNYKHGYALLDYAGDDADKVKAALKGLDYAVSSLTTDAKAGAVKHDALLEAAQELLSDRKPEDTVLFYFSGHGSLRDNKQYLLCTDTDPNLFEETAFSLETLGRLLSSCQAKHRVLIIDACRDTSKADGVSGFADGRLDAGFKDRLDAIARQAPTGVTAESAVLYACRPGQRSKESDNEGAGLFTLRLVDALRGKAGAEGVLTAWTVMRYVADAMPPALHGIQDPMLEGSGNLLLGTVISRRRSIPQVAAQYGLELVEIPSGEFPMGSTKTEVDAILASNSSYKRDWFTGEMPRHNVSLDTYYIAKNVVTVQEYLAFCAAAGHAKPTAPSWGWKEDHPIVNVSWNDATAYCTWLSEQTGLQVSLPTEAQWEKASRGADGRMFPWGNEWDGRKCANRVKPHDLNSTMPVGSYPSGASPYGVLDMEGSVCQWCSDWYDENYYHPSQDRNPPGPPKSPVGYRVLRGASWDSDDQGYFRCTYRNRYLPGSRLNYIGFRCVVRADTH